MDDLSYTFMTCESSTFRSSDEQRAADQAFFNSHPQRSYRVRPVHDDEAEKDEFGSFPYVIVRKTSSGEFRYRVITMLEGDPDDIEINGRWLWQIWEADDSGGCLFHGYEVYLLEQVFQNLKREEQEALKPTSGASSSAPS